jgi:predicted acyltransferase
MLFSSVPMRLTSAAMSELASATPHAATGPALPPGEGRLMSLDVFRGATIASMMLVNNPGSWSAVYPPLLHAPWHGWTFTDVIFPFFLWIVGVAIPLSMCRRMEQGQPRRELVLKIVRRSLILFGLGLFLNSFSYFIDGSLWRDGLASWWANYSTTVRIPGVLQRIAVCYFFAGMIFLSTGIRGQIMWTGAVLLIYAVLMLCVPVPGHGAGILEKEGNFSEYIDSLVLRGEGWNHMWKTSKTWDPEGIVSTLPAIATALFGILTGHMLRWKRDEAERTTWMFVAGSLLLWAGLVMNWWMPINKNLWTSSYAVFMAGMAMICFALCYWVIDVKGWRKWARPFAIYGMNAITVFVLAGILGRLSIEIKVTGAEGKAIALKTFLYQSFFVPLASPKVASLLWALAYVALLYLIAYVMYRRKWFVRF